MPCTKLVGHFSAWRDNKLDTPEHREILEHIDSCSDCRVLWAGYNEALDAVTSDMPEVPEAFRQEWRQAIRAKADSRSSQAVPAGRRERKIRFSGFTMHSGWLAACAGVVLIFAVGLILDGTGSGAGLLRPGTARDGGRMQSASDFRTFGTAAPGKNALTGTMDKMMAEEAQPSIAPAPDMKIAETGMAAGVPEARKVMYSASLALENRDVEKTCTELARLASQNQGFLRGSSVHKDGAGKMAGHVTIAIPSGRFEQIIRDIQGFGVVVNRDISGTDVTEEYVDLQARLKNWRTQEDQLNLIMTRAKNVEEILAVQNHLARVREEIERLTGRLNYLDRKVEYADITISVREPGGWKAEPIPVISALRELGGLLLRSVYQIFVLVATLLPWGLAGGALFLVGRAWWRKHRA